MTNKTTLQKWVDGRTEQECGDLITLLQVPANDATHDAPDADGEVALIGVRADHPFASKRWALGEIGDALPPGHAKNSVLGNLAYAQVLQRVVQDPTVACLPYDDAQGGLNFHAGAKPHSMAAAPLDGRSGQKLYYTAAALIAFLNSQLPATGGGGSFGPNG